MLRPAARIGVMAVLLLAGADAAAQEAAVFDGWITDRANGCRAFVPELRDYARISWRGPCVGGRAEGAGVLAVSVAGAPDRTYSVTFRRGRIDGAGTIEWDNGDRYEGEFRDGRRSGRVEAFAALAARTKFDSAASDDILLEMWEKWVLLATLAGMTCLMRAPVGAIVATREGESLTNELLAECSAVAAAAGRAPRTRVIEQSRAMLTARGSAFTASMLRDIERGGATEGDHILGDLLRRAGDSGIDTPVLRVAACHAEAYEARRKSTETAA